MTPQEMLHRRSVHENMISTSKRLIQEDEALAKFCKTPPKSKLRKATRRDIVSGAIIWYPRSIFQKWKIVEASWVSGIINDGHFIYQETKYSLRGAWIEK